GEDVLVRHARAELDNPGYYRDLKRGGDYHTHNKTVVDALTAVSGAKADGNGGSRNGSSSNGDGEHHVTQDMVAAHLLQAAIRAGNTELYDSFSSLVNERPAAELHDLLELVPPAGPIPVDEVEPATAIVRRFSTGAMSHGS